MNTKTTTLKHTEFFDVIEDESSLDLSQYSVNEIYVGIEATNILFQNKEVCYLKPIEGIVSFVVSHQLEISSLHRFVLHGFVAVKPDVFFNCLTITPHSKYLLYTPKQSFFEIHHFEQEIRSKQIVEQFFVPQIYTFYQQLKHGPYYYPNESHPYCEMTIVDFGEFITEVSGTTYTLNSQELIIYGPNQMHNQRVESNTTCRYVTIMFEMKPIYTQLLNRIFSLSSSQLRLLEEILRTEMLQVEFREELIVSKFKEFIISLLDAKPMQLQHRITSMRTNYENDLLNQIIHYIHDNIYQALYVSDLCRTFSISRTSIQAIFNKYLADTPKNYINKAKLDQSKILIMESKYTISEIATMLGYSSIHYFSRAFKLAFGLSPSDYAKSILK